MPKGEVPERYLDILASTALGHLATIGLDGRPQVNPVWFLADGHSVYLSVKPETAKYRNLRTNPAVAMSVGDLARPDRYVRSEVRSLPSSASKPWPGSTSWRASIRVPTSPEERTASLATR